MSHSEVLLIVDAIHDLMHALQLTIGFGAFSISFAIIAKQVVPKK